MTDKERIDWLEKENGGVALIHDDFGYWAVCFDGHQPVVTGPHTTTFDTMYFVAPAAWRPTIREAIDAAMEEAQR